MGAPKKPRSKVPPAEARRAIAEAMRADLVVRQAVAETERTSDALPVPLAHVAEIHRAADELFRFLPRAGILEQLPETWQLTLPGGLVVRLLALIDTHLNEVAAGRPAEEAPKTPPEAVTAGDWRELDTKEGVEIALFREGERVGAVHNWHDTKSGEYAWSSGVIVVLGKDAEIRDFYDTEEEARASVVRALDLPEAARIELLAATEAQVSPA